MPIVSCIEPFPNSRTLYLAGKAINISRVQQMTGIDRAYISRMLNGIRPPENMSLGTAMLLAGCLGLSVEELIDAIYERQAKLKRTKAQLQVWADYMLSREKANRTRLSNQGLPAPPSVPLI